MQQWDYLYFWTSNEPADVSKPGQGYCRLNRAYHNYEQEEDVFAMLESLGRDGWELVSTPTEKAFIFKRPLAESK